MKRALYSVSPIGLGHATRSEAVARELVERGWDVRFVSAGHALEFLRSGGFDAVGGAEAPVPSVSGGEMKRASLWYARYWLAYRRSRASLGRAIDEYRPQLVVGDEEFSSVSVAVERGIPNALVTDEEELSFARTPVAMAIERRVSAWYGSLLDRVQAVAIPDKGADSGNRKHVGPIVRRVTRSGAEVRGQYSLPREGRMALLSLSGSGIGAHLVPMAVEAVRQAGVPAVFLVITGNRGRRFRGQDVYDLGVVRENQNLVAAADLVISTAGKSTIDEAASAGTPCVVVPIRNHSEQERNASALGSSASDAEGLAKLVAAMTGRRGAPVDSRGAENASRLFETMAG